MVNKRQTWVLGGQMPVQCRRATISTALGVQSKAYCTAGLLNCFGSDGFPSKDHKMDRSRWTTASINAIKDGCVL